MKCDTIGRRDGSGVCQNEATTVTEDGRKHLCDQCAKDHNYILNKLRELEIHFGVEPSRLNTPAIILSRN